jgi:hypothetical protein
MMKTKFPGEKKGKHIINVTASHWRKVLKLRDALKLDRIPLTMYQ